MLKKTCSIYGGDMERPILQPGDIFFSENSWMFNWIIKLYQKQSSQDGKAEFGHAGTIIKSSGTTFEALSKYKHQNIFEAYKGQKVLIGRHVDMTPAKAKKGYDSVKWKLGKRYPWWRIVALGIGVAKWMNITKLGDCSETMYEQLYNSGVSDQNWNGKTPDNGADMVRDFKGWSTVFKGYLP